MSERKIVVIGLLGSVLDAVATWAHTWLSDDDAVVADRQPAE